MSEMSLNEGSASSSMGSMGAEAAAAAAAARADPREELNAWTALALSHQLGAMGKAVADAADQAALADAYWAALCEGGKEHDAATRRFLIPGAAAASPEGLVRLWISCVLGAPLPTEGDFEPLLRSGELLCKFLNAIRPGIVPRIATYAELMEMGDSKRNAKMRENIGQYIDGCAELGLPQADLFMPDDLFEGKDFRSVVKNLEALMRFAASDSIPGYKGPLVGKQLKKNITPAKVHAQVAPPRVVLSGGKGPSGIVGRS